MLYKFWIEVNMWTLSEIAEMGDMGGIGDSRDIRDCRDSSKQNVAEKWLRSNTGNKGVIVFLIQLMARN